MHPRIHAAEVQARYMRTRDVSHLRGVLPKVFSLTKVSRPQALEVHLASHLYTYIHIHHDFRRHLLRSSAASVACMPPSGLQSSPFSLRANQCHRNHRHTSATCNCTICASTSMHLHIPPTAAPPMHTAMLVTVPSAMLYLIAYSVLGLHLLMLLLPNRLQHMVNTL
jgi:hypothetical protein